MVRFIDIYIYIYICIVQVRAKMCFFVFSAWTAVGVTPRKSRREREKKDVEENRATKTPEATVPKCAEGAWGLVTSEV